MKRLEGKAAVITGGNSGIGLATAERFIAEGAKVAVFGRNQATLDQAAAKLGSDSLAVQGDVTKMGDLDRLMDAVRTAFGRIDILFANAAIADFAPFAEMDPDRFDRVVDVNFKGTYFTIQKALPLLSDGASVIITTSGANVKGYPNTSVYAATKAALRSLARTLSTELLPRKIRVNALSPGSIETPMIGRLGLNEEESKAMVAAVLSGTPAKRFGRPEEMAAAAAFLASDDASYVMGSELVADGGLTEL